MRKDLTATVAALALLTLAGAPWEAGAQTAPQTGTPEQDQGAEDTAPESEPLLTAPRPEDQPTTDPIPVTPGVDGAAPSRELTEEGMGEPVEVPPADPDAPAATGTAETPTPPPGEPAAEPAPQQAQPALTPSDAQALVGQLVESADGERIGRIHDFLLGGPGGPIEQVVIASGGLFGLGQRLTAVPADQLQVTAPAEAGGQMTVTLNMNAQDIRAQPRFEYGEGAQSVVNR